MTHLFRRVRRKKVPVVGIFLFSLCSSVYFSFKSMHVWKNEWIIQDEAFLPTSVVVVTTTSATTTESNNSKAEHHQAMTTEEPLNPANATAAAKIFYERHLESINSLVNKSTALVWQGRFKNPFQPFKEALDENPIIIPWGKVPQDFVADHLRNKSRHIIVWRDICAASRAMVAYRNSGQYKPHPHILVTRLNENWGEFSTLVPNRTTDDERWTGLTDEKAWKAKGCTLEFILDYINHNDTRAVVTTQHQLLNHPKVHSLPLGIISYDPDLKELLYELRNPSMPTITLAVDDPRPQLLMVNSKPRKMRVHVLNMVIQNFHGTVQNTYQPDGNYRNYLAELRRSKFILSPSGMGLDCYRHWEAIHMGTIPVLEHLNRSDGLYSNFDDLPVAWIDHYDNLTPEFLEQEYQRITAQPRRYNYEKLTRQWWIHKIKSTLQA
jgi:hypothetical protein